MRKKKYIVPRLQSLLVTEYSYILAGSPTERENPDGPGMSESEGGEGSRAKESTFSTWEDWDEY